MHVAGLMDEAQMRQTGEDLNPDMKAKWIALFKARLSLFLDDSGYNLDDIGSLSIHSSLFLSQTVALKEFLLHS